ncbi:MAG: protein kinase, partial [Deltaproteobacteria bacterium]|nr:protein kinase [Deltaproteobacteria bacterium]
VAVELICQAAHGLHDAHEAKTPIGQPLEIVHRDVSPQNVLVGVDGRVRLTDFGVARAVQRMTETIAGRVKGKFAYMAPEQLTAQKIDRRADVFSLGVVAWEFFTGTRLFLGEHPAETMDRVRNMPILAVNEVRTDVPPMIAEVIAWALERDPNERCPSAREFEINLRQAAQKSGVESDRDGVVRFVQGAGGASLDKMRNNIKVALTDRPGDAIEGGLDQPLEYGLTPSGIQPSSGGAADTHDTAPTTGGQGTKSRGPLLIGLMGAAVIALGGVIGIVVALSGDEVVEPVVTELANPGVATPPAVPDPVAAETVTEDEAEGQALDPEAAIEEDSAPVADEPAATPRTAARRRADRRRRNMRQVAAAPVEPTAAVTPPAMVTAMTTTTTTTMTTPPPTMTTRPRMDRGLVGLDAFDQGLNMR